MAMNDTIVTICGNLGADPEHKRLDDGTDLATFRVGTSSRRFVDGQFVDGPTSWYQVSAWGGLALNCIASLGRGQRVIVHGALRVRPWNKLDDDGREIFGKSVDLRAISVGHDLLWGTTSYERVVRTEKIEHPGQAEADAFADDVAARLEGLPDVDADGVLREPQDQPARV